jgi:hypothetical protein
MGGTRSTLTELGQVLTRRSQVPIAHFPSAGPHRVQGTPKICSPCYTRVSLLLGDTRKEIPTQRFHLKCSHSDAVRIYCCYLICSSSARAHILTFSISMFVYISPTSWILALTLHFHSLQCLCRCPTLHLLDRLDHALVMEGTIPHMEIHSTKMA